MDSISVIVELCSFAASVKSFCAFEKLWLYTYHPVAIAPSAGNTKGAIDAHNPLRAAPKAVIPEVDAVAAAPTSVIPRAAIAAFLSTPSNCCNNPILKVSLNPFTFSRV